MRCRDRSTNWATCTWTRAARSCCSRSSPNERSASIAIATNAPFSEWGHTFTDPRLAAAVVDRLTFSAHILETGSDSYRLRASRAKKGTAKAS